MSPARHDPDTAARPEPLGQALAERLCELAAEKKARAASLYDVRELTSYTDFILILGATSDRHARALADHLRRSLREQGVRPVGVEGEESGHWVLLDYGDVIVHVMQEQTRTYYDLDGLWIDARRLPAGEEA